MTQSLEKLTSLQSLSLDFTGCSKADNAVIEAFVLLSKPLASLKNLDLNLSSGYP